MTTIGKDCDDAKKSLTKEPLIQLNMLRLEKDKGSDRDKKRVKLLEDWLMELSTYSKFSKEDMATKKLQTEDELIKIARNLLMTVSLSEGYLHLNKLDKQDPDLCKKVTDYCQASYDFVKNPGKIV